MAIDFKSLFSIGPTVCEAGRHHRGDHGIDLNSNSHAEYSPHASTTRPRDVTQKWGIFISSKKVPLALAGAGLNKPAALCFGRELSCYLRGAIMFLRVSAKEGDQARASEAPYLSGAC